MFQNTLSNRFYSLILFWFFYILLFPMIGTAGDLNGSEKIIGEEQAILTYAPEVPPPITRKHATKVNDIKKIEAALSEEVPSKVHFTLFSIDPERDTPETLKAYSQKHNLNLNHWTLLTGDSDDVLELAVVLGVKYRKDNQGGFSHSNIISVLDQEGIIRTQQIGLNQDPHPTLNILNQFAAD